MDDDYSLKLVKTFGMTGFLKHDPSVPDSDVDLEYMATHNWIVGSPATVADKIERLHAQVGGFGVLLVLGFDYLETPDAWRRSLDLLANDVMPRLKHIG